MGEPLQRGNGKSPILADGYPNLSRSIYSSDIFGFSSRLKMTPKGKSEDQINHSDCSHVS